MFYKKDVLRNFPKSRKEHLHQILFLIEPDSVDLQLHLNGDFSTVIFVSFAKFVGHLFLQNNKKMTASDYGSMNSSKEQLGNETVNYDIEIKHTNLIQKCTLSKRTVQAKKQV